MLALDWVLHLAIEQAIDQSIVVANKVTEVVLQSNLYGQDHGQSNQFLNLMIRDRNMILLQQAVLDPCILNDSKIVSANMRGIIHIHSKALKHVMNGNNLF